MNTAVLTQHDVTLPAGEVRNLDVTGTLFVVTAASGDFSVKIGNGEFVPWVAGLKGSLPSGEVFTRLSVKNTETSNTITVTLYAGRVDVALVQSIANVAVSNQNAATADRATNGTSASVSFVGNYARGSSPGGTSHSQRKQITVQNLDSSNAITLLIGTTKIYSLEAGTSWTMETQATIVLDNAGGAEYAVHEVFYQWS